MSKIFIFLKVNLKIALLIGNCNYETNDEEIKMCRKCQSPGYNLTNLNMSESIETLRQRLEELGYLVMAFIDLDADNYLRAVRLARQICDQAESVSVLIYIAGHGYNYLSQDYLIPINTKLLLHHNNHDYKRILYSSLSLCSLSNLLESFKPLYLDQNISVVVFWDLCRREW